MILDFFSCCGTVCLLYTSDVYKRQPLPHAEEKGAFFVYQRELAPGTRLEQYEIIRVLGSGG